jgi:hypothetical protein
MDQELMDVAIVEKIRAIVQARLGELAPALAEFEQLQSVLAILEGPDAGRRLAGVPGISVVSGDFAHLTEASVTPLPFGQVHSKRGSDGRAPQGANKRRILAMIAEHPGITAPRIAELTGLKRPVVASTISRLKRTGELCPYGNGVCLPDAGAQRSAQAAG